MNARIALFAAGIVFITAGCTKIESSSSAENPKTDRPQQELYDATITFYQDDCLNAVLQSGRIRKFERQSVILLDSGVVMDFYNKEGRHTSKLWADSGRTDEIRKDMVAMGNVIARSDSGEMLESSELRWDNKTRQIRSDVPVKLSTPTDTIYGIYFVSDENLRNWRIEQPYGKTFREWDRRMRDTTAVTDSTVVEAAPAVKK
jgi:LPS export ABC transporter protein LptC